MQSVVKIKDIIIKNRLRPLNKKIVDELVESIQEHGLINPITINNCRELLAGYHRLEACKKLGFIDIDCNVLPHVNLDAELIEIDENLIRCDLTVLEHSEFLNRRKEIYEIKFPETKKGAINQYTKNPLNDNLSFSKDTSSKTGLSSRTISRGVQIADNIIPEVKEKILNLPIADKKTELLKLARLEPEKQIEITDKLISGEIDNINESTEMSPEEWEIEESTIAFTALGKWKEKYQHNRFVSEFISGHNL